MPGELLMPMPKWLPDTVLICFLLTVSVVLLLGITTLLRLCKEAIRTKTTPKPNRKEILILAAFAFGLMCFLYGLLIEPYSFSVTRISLQSEKLSGKNGPIKLIHISDLHCDPQLRLEDTLTNRIAAEHPDIIAFTGDALNSPGGLANLRACLKRLSKIAPTFVVKGNWDAYFFREIDRFSDTGVVELDGKPVKCVVRGTEVWMCGLPIGSDKTSAMAVQGVPKSEYCVFLYHYPDYIETMAKNGVDLYLAGHTHGGQVALPFYGALMTMSARGKEFESGLYSFENTHLYVNRGIGMEGGIAPRVRFCAPPELTVFTLSGSR